MLELHGGIVRATARSPRSPAASRSRPACESSRFGPDEDGVSLETSSGTVEAALAVVAAGAWATPLLADAGIELETTSRRRPSRTSTSRRLTPCRRSSTGTRRRAGTRTRCRPARTSSRSGCTTRACRSSPASRGSRIPMSSKPSRSGCGGGTLRRIPRPEAPRRASTRTSTRTEFVIERHGVDHRLLGVLRARLQVRTGCRNACSRARVTAGLSSGHESAGHEPPDEVLPPRRAGLDRHGDGRVRPPLPLPRQPRAADDRPPLLAPRRRGGAARRRDREGRRCHVRRSSNEQWPFPRTCTLGCSSRSPRASRRRSPSTSSSRSTARSRRTTRSATRCSAIPA